MKVLYYESDIDVIIEDIELYIEQSDDTPQQKVEYRKELEKVKNDFEELANSGVFQDTFGKTMEVLTDNGELVVEVETDY